MFFFYLIGNTLSFFCSSHSFSCSFVHSCSLFSPKIVMIMVLALVYLSFVCSFNTPILLDVIYLCLVQFIIIYVVVLTPHYYYSSIPFHPFLLLLVSSFARSLMTFLLFFIDIPLPHSPTRLYSPCCLPSLTIYFHTLLMIHSQLYYLHDECNQLKYYLHPFSF